jgi:hypothetical protein
MTLTAEQRADISRENGKKSRGPVSEQGKSRSRLNALRHGLRAEVLPLPNEDPAKVAEREAAWNDYYQPQSPAAQHLVTECVRATLLADRCHAFHAAALSKQVREAPAKWDAEQDDAVTNLTALLPNDPAEAVRLLKQSAAGCRWLLGRWERLADAFTAHGWWAAEDRDEALRLRGSRPHIDRLRSDPDGYALRFLNQVCLEPTGPQKGVLELLDPLFMPAVLRADYGPGKIPPAHFCRKMIGDLVAAEVAHLRRVEARLHELEEPDRAEAADRALILHDPVEARIFLRYHAESRTAFHRAYAQLLKTLERDAAEGPAAEGPAGEPAAAAPEASPNEPTEAAEAEPSGSPNEPTEAPAGPEIAPNEPEPAGLAVSEPSETEPDEARGRGEAA